MYDGIIDLNHNDDIDFAKVKAKGEIAAIIHKVSEGSTFVDQHFDERRKAARSLGFLWGVYHFGTNADVGAQLKNFLAHAKIEATDFVALDYEKRTLKDGSDITMSLDQAEEFVTRLHEKLGRFPAIYGSDLLAHAAQVRPQSVLGRCHLWLAAYTTHPAPTVPSLWPKFTLWQYTDGLVGGDPKVTEGTAGPGRHGPIPGVCDRSRFADALADLQKAWPLAS